MTKATEDYTLRRQQRRKSVISPAVTPVTVPCGGEMLDLPGFPFSNVDVTMFLTLVGFGLLAKTADSSNPEVIAARARFQPIHELTLILRARRDPTDDIVGAFDNWFKAMTSLIAEHIRPNRRELQEAAVVDLIAYRGAR